MAGVFDRDLGALAAKDGEARLSELADYISYMQQAVEDFESVTTRRLRALEQRVKELENNG
ncbi:hypothetical protein SDC9_169359 [bioreactor metagenome]|uniref:Uncharacterized protein n=1 Tax=bioreactor metagenome TaxID=1076179 RepID=A0A645G4Z1_9ZZZZ